MKMEIKVDVHTVHPASPPAGVKKPPNKPVGSWGTPLPTPKHPVIRECRSNIETKLRFQDETECKEVFPLQKVEHATTKSAPDCSIECFNQQFQNIVANVRKQSSPDIEILQSEDIETPQSPVPPSPSKQLRPFQMPTIDPQGRGYISWLCLATFCYSYNAWCIMLRATFPYQTPENIAFWMTADYFSDLVYLIDVMVVKPRLMFLHEGFWVDDVRETRRNYQKKTQFRFDVVSLLPLDVLYLMWGPEKVILRAPRILKLHTFWEFHQTMDRMLSSPYIVRIGKMLFYIFYLIHLNACAYYAMSSYIGLASNEWVYDNKGNAYIRCFYFATKTATSIGKNPKPEQTSEYLYMTGAWLMGVFVFALLIGQIRDIIATATRARVCI